MLFRRLWLTGVIGVLALTATGLHSSQDENKSKSKEHSSKDLEAAEAAYEQALKGLKHQLEIFADQGTADFKSKSIPDLNIQTQKAEAATADLTTPSVSSPLKVRGGAMTVFARTRMGGKAPAPSRNPGVRH